MLKSDLNVELKSSTDYLNLITMKNEDDKNKSPWCNN